MFWILGSVFGFWEVFWILGSVLDSGKCFVFCVLLTAVFVAQ